MSLFIYCKKKNNEILHIEKGNPTNFNSSVEHYLIEVNYNNINDVTVNFDPIAFSKDSSRLYITADKKVSTYSDKEIEDALDALKLEEDKAKQIAEAKKYLSDTDFKVLPDYDQDSTEVKVKRQEAREFIRANETLI